MANHKMGEMKGEIQDEDYCFECKKWIDTDEQGHMEHEKLSNRVDKPSKDNRVGRIYGK